MTKAMTNTGVSFERQFKGYNREQVDQYIASLAQAYQIAYDEYNSVCCKYSDLLEENEGLKEQNQNTPSADVLSKTLVNAELLAQKIIEDAKAESENMRAKAQADSKKIIDDAYQGLIIIQQEKAMLIAEIYDIAEKLKALRYKNEPHPFPKLSQ